MSELENKTLTPAPEEETNNEDFMQQVEATMVRIRPGQTVTGKVVQITDDEVSVNIGYKADGLIKKEDLVDQDVKLGDEIEVEVVKVNDGEGNVLLSQRNIVNRKAWDALMAKYEAGEYVDAVGKEAVKGGLIANVDGIRAFVPASQLSQRYVEKIGDFVGKEMRLKIIEVDEQKKRIVASRKAVIVEEAAAKKKEVWDKLEEGIVIHGIVRRLTDFGAFVDLGGVDGMVHTTELSWRRIRRPSDVVSVGDKIHVYVKGFDRERGRISLGYKTEEMNPWYIFTNQYHVGDVVEVKIVSLMPFGAFAEIVPGCDGLIHISQIADHKIAKPDEVLAVGDMVKVRITAIDYDNKKVSLSIRSLLEEAANAADDEEYYDEPAGEETADEE